MATNLAVKRGRRALRRKQAVAQQRRRELFEPRFGPEARRAALAPIRLCVLQGDIVEGGMASVVLARGQTPSILTAGIFLVDTFCLGIKDVIIREVDSEELAFTCEGMSGATPLTAVEPAYARKLLREVAAWASSIGFKPHRDFAAIEQMFGDVNPDASDAAFTFGMDGKPFYMPGPTETQAQIRHRLAHLRSHCGEGGFEYTVEL